MAYSRLFLYFVHFSIDKKVNMIYPCIEIMYLLNGNNQYMDTINLNNKRERFKRLAEYRTNEVLKRLRVLGNCSNRSAYEYNEEEIAKIFSEIERAVRENKSKFHFPKSKKFKL